MADKKFALPLDSKSKQDGDITFEELTENDAAVEFRLTNVTAGSSNSLNLVTKKNGTVTNHPYTVTIAGGIASVTLTPAQMRAVYDDADGEDWDYVEAAWVVGSVETPAASIMIMIQNGQPYNRTGWPPKTR